MKKLYILLTLIAFAFTSCEKDDPADAARIFKIEAAGTNYSFKITRRDTGTTTEGGLESLNGINGAYAYEFNPEIGKTYKVTLSGAGLTSWKVSYKGQELIYSVATGSGLNRDFEIKD